METQDTVTTGTAEEERGTTSVRSGTKAKIVPSGERKEGKKLKASQPVDIHPSAKGKAKGGKSKGAPPGTRETKSQKAGITFPVAKVQRKLRKGKNMQRTPSDPLAKSNWIQKTLDTKYCNA